MAFRQITDAFSASPQITPGDIAAIRAAGFRAIICNRPDGEGPGQPGFEEIETAAAARKQAPVMAQNIVTAISGREAVAQCDGYGSCPLTVERRKIVLAAFGHGGALKPGFPRFVIDGTRPSRAAWFLKERMSPPIYWKAMLSGREWMACPEKLSVTG